MTGGQLGSYEQLYELSRGGMGEVWLAKRHGSHGFEKLVALKTIRRDLHAQDSLRRMFLDEARVVSLIQHPSIAQVFDFGEQDERLFLAMEYVAGLSLSRILTLHRDRLPAAVAVRIIAAACRGLHAAHEATDLEGRALGLVHRDVSPQNLMVTFDGHVKVIDFGIAIAAGRFAASSKNPEIVGKPAYMAPEQLRSSSGVDRRADVFSAAVVLHEMVSKRRLFRRTSLAKTAEAVRTAPIPPLEGPYVPADLNEVVRHALARDRVDRFATCAAFADALEALAPQMAVDTTHRFALEVMQAQREEHDRLLRQVLTGATTEAPLGDAEAPRVRTQLGTMVAVGRAFSQSEESDDDTQRSGPAPADTVSLGGDPPKKPWPLFALAAAFALLAIGYVATANFGPEQTEVIGTTVPKAPATVTPTKVQAMPPTKAEVQDAGQTGEPPKSPWRRRTVRRRTSPKPKVAPPAPIDAGVIERGRLIVTATPWAEVWIDGRYVDKTPLRTQLPAGGHKVELRSPDTNEVRTKRSVNVQPGLTVRVTARPSDP